MKEGTVQVIKMVHLEEQDETWLMTYDPVDGKPMVRFIVPEEFAEKTASALGIDIINVKKEKTWQDVEEAAEVVDADVLK